MVRKQGVVAAIVVLGIWGILPTMAGSLQASATTAQANQNLSNSLTTPHAIVATETTLQPWTFNIDGEVSTVTFSLFAGEITGKLDGALAIDLDDDNVPTPGTGYAGISIKRAVFVMTEWDADVEAFRDPYIMYLDSDHNSQGWFNRKTGIIWFTLYMTDQNSGSSIPMPLFISGTLSNGELAIAGGNQNVADAEMFVDIVAHRVTFRPDIHFSTEIGFPIADSAGATRWISDGDLLSARRCLLQTNHRLMANFGIMPPTPDVGLDAITLSKYRPVMFSTEETVWSETLGQWVGEGDLLCNTGRIVMTNAQLISEFGPITSVAGVGLDALHIMTGPFAADTTAACRPRILFSVEQDFYSPNLNRWIRHGDLLSQCGCVIRTNRQLLANFDPIAIDYDEDDDSSAGYGPCGGEDDVDQSNLIYCDNTASEVACRDFGLDAVYVRSNGEIWFSVERGFWDSNIGWISCGDVLSTRGYVVAQNRRLVDICDPLVDCANFGLDALDWIYRVPLPYDNADSAVFDD